MFCLFVCLFVAVVVVVSLFVDFVELFEVRGSDFRRYACLKPPVQIVKFEIIDSLIIVGFFYLFFSFLFYLPVFPFLGRHCLHTLIFAS